MKSEKILNSVTIRKWAYKKPNQNLPVQFEELDNVAENGELLLSLVSDKLCPQRINIMNCLYSVIGKSASKNIKTNINLINTLLAKAELHHDLFISNWVSRSRIILQDMRKYDYVEWCEGGFVRKDFY
jgi:hypothetical protein